MGRPALAFVAGMLILPAVACALAWLGAWSVDAIATPPAWEQALTGGVRLECGLSGTAGAARTRCR